MFDPASIAAAGSFLSGVGSVFGGLGSKGTSRKRERDSARIASEEAIRHSKNAPAAAVEGFRKAGIHPLFGLTGASGITAMPSYSTPGSDSGPDFAAVGQGIQRAATAFTGRAEREIAAKATELGLENQSLQNEYIRTQIRHMNAPGQPPGLSGGHFIPGQGDSAVARAKEMLATMDTPFGRKQGAVPLHKTSYDENGDPLRWFNEEDLGDNDVGQAAHFAGYTFPDFVHNIARNVARKMRRNSPRYTQHRFK